MSALSQGTARLSFDAPAARALLGSSLSAPETAQRRARSSMNPTAA
jgi:hypothetical protein